MHLLLSWYLRNGLVAVFSVIIFVQVVSAQVQPPSATEVNCRHTTLRTDAAPFRLAPADGYDLIRLNIFWNVDPQTGSVFGNITYYFRALHELDTFYLDMSDSLSLLDAWHHGGSISGDAHHSENILAIRFNQPIPSGTYDSITISYNGIPGLTGGASFMLSGHNGDSIVATLSEPYGSRDWWPSKMSLSDKIDSVDIAVKVPEHYKVGSNGKLTHIDVMGSPFVVYHWRSRYPIATYLIGIAAYPYTEIIHNLPIGNDTIFMQHYVYPDFADAITNHQPVLDSVFQLFTEWFGPYPFIKEKYGHAQWNRGGGMEHQTMSFVSDFNYELVAHELAHQWFGDKITCGSWTDIWLNEGWATYATSLTYEKLANGFWWVPSLNTINSRALKDSTGSVFCDDTTSVPRIFDSRLSYGKGACILHSLRYLMKDHSFFNATRDYLNDSTLAYGFSKTQQFKHHLENHYGNLDEFFNDWYYGKGHPDLQLYWHQNENQVICRLLQTSYAHPDDGFVFDMTVPVKFYGNNTDTTIDLNHHNAFDSYNLTIPFQIDSVKIDPELWWLIGKKRVTRLAYLSEPGDVHIFPNPVTDKLTIVTENEEDEIIRIQIFNVDGKEMFDSDVSSTKAFEPLTLDVSLISAGAYVVRIQGSRSTQTIKLVKLP